MARGYSIISGKIGPVVVCHITRTNSIIYRSRPKKYQQTAGTLASQKNFGKASAAGRVLRKGLTSIIPFPKDKMMQGKFSGAINRWMGTTPFNEIQPVYLIPALNEFSFNESTKLSTRWKVTLSLQHTSDLQLQLEIPAFIPTEKIAAPAGTVSVECLIAAAGCMLENGEEAGHFSYRYEFPLNDIEQPGKIIPLGISMKPGSLIICGVMLIYHVKGKTGNSPTKNIHFIPSAVVGACYG